MNKIFKSVAVAAMSMTALTGWAVDTGGVLQYVSVTPENNATIDPSKEEDKQVTITYSEDLLDGIGSVTMNAVGSDEIINPMAYISWMDAKQYVVQFPTDDMVVGTTYRLSIPAGIVKGEETNKENPAYEFFYTMGAATQVGLTFYPEEGITTEINNPLWVFLSDEAAELDSSKEVVMNYNGNDYKGSLTNQSGVWSVQFKELPSPITQPGTYTITFPEGLFYSGDAKSPLTTRTWTIQETVMTPLNMTSVTPTQESAIALGTKIYVAFDTDEVNASFDMMAVVNFFNATQNKDAGQVVIPFPGEDVAYNVVAFRFSPVGAVAGDKIVCTIPAGTVWNTYNESMQNEELSLVYYVEGESGGDQSLLPASVTPADASTIVCKTDDKTGLGRISLTFDVPVTVAEDAASKVVFVNTDNNVVYPIGNVRFFNLTGDNMVFVETADMYYNYKDLRVSGNYKMTIPAGVFTDAAGNSNKELVYNWTVDGEEASTTLNVVSTVPADKAIVESFKDFTVTFNYPVTVKSGATAVVKIPNSKNDAICGITTKVENPNSVSISLDEELTTEGDYNVSIPAAAINAGDMTNSMLDFTVTVGDATLKVLTIEPSNDEPIAAFAEDAYIRFTLNRASEVAFAEGKLVDLNPANADDAIVFTMRPFIKEDNGGFVSAKWTDAGYVACGNAIDYKLYEGHEYDLVITCYDSQYDGTRKEVGEVTVKYVGATKQTIFYSTATIDEVTPAPGSVLTADTPSVKIKFSEAADFKTGYATYGGQMAATTTVTATATDYSKTEYELTIDKKFIEEGQGEITYVVVFTDEYGKYIVPQTDTRDFYRGFNGTTQEPTIAMRYDCFEGGVEVNVDPAAGEVTSLYEFKFTNPHESSENVIDFGGVSVNTIELLNAAGERVAYGAKVETETQADASAQKCTWVKVTLDKMINENGEYTLVVPQTALTLGTEFMADVFKGMKVKYTIVGNNTQYTLIPTEVVPADNAVVESLKTITFKYDEEVALNASQANGVIVTKTGTQYRGTYTLAEDKKSVLFTLDGDAITEAGRYILTVGKNTIGNKVWADANMADGKANDETTYAWTIEAVVVPTVYDLVPLSVDPADKAEVTSLSLITLNFDEEAEVAVNPDAVFVIKDATGKEYACTATSFVNMIEIKAAETITAAGTYTLTIAQGSYGTQTWVDTEYAGGNANAETVYTWTIKGSGVEAIFGENGTADVYGVNGVCVMRNADASMLKSLAKGLYIVNGKKVVVK